VSNLSSVNACQSQPVSVVTDLLFLFPATRRGSALARLPSGRAGGQAPLAKPRPPWDLQQCAAFPSQCDRRVSAAAWNKGRPWGCDFEVPSGVSATLNSLGTSLSGSCLNTALPSIMCGDSSTALCFHSTRDVTCVISAAAWWAGLGICSGLNPSSLLTHAIPPPKNLYKPCSTVLKNISWLSNCDGALIPL